MNKRWPIESSRSAASGAELSRRARPRSYYFLTPVWGREFTRLYTETVIPAQLAKGNLPAIEKPHARYVIYTTPADAETIRSAEVFKYLAETIPVVFQFISEEIVAPLQTQADCFRRGIAMADDAGAAIIFLKPDMVFADGSFATLQRLAQSGQDVVYVPGIRTIKQDVSAALRRRFSQSGAISIGPRDLMRLAIDHLHPLGASSWWEEGEGDLSPANLYWRVGDDGIVARCFHLHPLLVYPQRKNAIFFGTEDDDYPSAACPDASFDYVVTDSDEMLAIELSDVGRFFEVGFRKGSVSEAVTWAEQFADPRHRRLFGYTVRMHTGISDEAAWSAAEKRAASVAGEITASLQLPAWRLLGDPDRLIRRVIRGLKNTQLRAANFRTGELPTGMASRCLRFAAARLGWLANLPMRLAVLSRSVAGTLEQPAPHSFASLHQERLGQHLASIGVADSHPLVISAERGSTHLSALLRRENTVFGPHRSLHADGERALDRDDDGEAIAPGSLPLVILQAHTLSAERLGDLLREASDFLTQGGRLVIYLELLPPHPTASKSRHRSVPEIAALLPAELVIEQVQLQGGLGSRIRSALRRRGGLRRSFAQDISRLSLAALYPAISPARRFANAATAWLDALVSSERFAVSMLIVARKTSEKSSG